MEARKKAVLLKLNRPTTPKPLVGNFFRDARDFVLQKKFSKQSGSTRSPCDVSTSFAGLSQASLCNDHGISESEDSRLSPQFGEKSIPIQLFALTPSETEPQRFSRGGLLDEADSLQAKHAAEYVFLVPVINHALNATIIAHNMWLKDKLQNSSYTHKQTVGQVEGGSNDVNNSECDVATSKWDFDVFKTSKNPSISLHDYIQLIVDQTYVSPSVLLVACLYIDRLLFRNTSLLLSSLNVFKLLAISTRVASKVMDTRTLNNKNFAKACSMSNTELTFLESHFIRCLDFELYVSAAEFYAYADCFVAQSPARAPLLSSPLSHLSAITAVADGGAPRRAAGGAAGVEWSLPVLHSLQGRCGSANNNNSNNNNNNNNNSNNNNNNNSNVCSNNNNNREMKQEKPSGSLPPVVLQSAMGALTVASRTCSPLKIPSTPSKQSKLFSATAFGKKDVAESEKGVCAGASLFFLRKSMSGLPVIAPNCKRRQTCLRN